MNLVVHQKHFFYNSYRCNAHYNDFRSKCMWRSTAATAKEAYK
jgi:hypothetical protein